MIGKHEEIARVFREEHGADMVDVLLGVTGKIRILLNKVSFNEEDMALAESMLGFVSEHIPSELFPKRMDFIKDMLWKCINRGVPQKIYNPNKQGKNKWENNYLWHPDY